MFHGNDWEGFQQWQWRFQETAGLPFSALLSAAVVEQALAASGANFRERIYTPVVTLWTFLSQVLSPDHSCRDAVARLLAWRVSRGMPACSADSSSYCEARERLPLEAIRAPMRETARQLQAECDDAWLWKGRAVKVVDGTTTTMPDTAKNRAAFPRPRDQAQGVGFPIARLVVIFSLACGAALEAALGPAIGKKTGENSLFRAILSTLNPGDVLLGDRLFDSFHDIALLQGRGVDVVFRMNQSRGCDFRHGRWLGTLDHVVTWTKPKFDAARFDRAGYDALPAVMQMRELRFRVQQDGFRTKDVVLVTTLLDAVQFPTEDVAGLYRERWHCELDLNALKTTMEMEHLRCKTPQRVEKEIWAHLLAYNLIRRLMAQAAREHGVLPRHVSFKGAVQTMNSFAPYLTLSLDAPKRLWKPLLKAIASHLVGDRPNRVEPRKLKRHKDRYPHMTQPRNQERQRLYT